MTEQLYYGRFLMPSLEHATVSDAMHPGIVSCEPDATLLEVARMMATHQVHCLAVIGSSHEEPESSVWGIISDLDVIRAGIRNGGQPTARTLAQQRLVTVGATVPLREAGELILAHGVSHLVVIETETKRPIGILSTLDLARVLAWGKT